uniref:Retrotransposon gag domain-containing protein n=1 Tax=Oryza sativa subsp. japonica TaxID=39947 RepID=Q75H45_ORYSJ|nr:hypothetical protein [Oryza sativa Japonica Group]
MTKEAAGAEEGGGAARVDGDDGVPAVGELGEVVDGVGGGAAKPEKAMPRREMVPCGEASAMDALRVMLFWLSLSGSAFTWFSSLPYGSINSWADLEKHFHSYFYSGVHEMKLSDLTAIKQRHDEPVHEYIQRFREMRNKCYSLSLTDAQLVDLAFQGMIAPIREKFSSEDFESLSHLTQKIAALEWVRSKKVIPYQWVKNSRKEERYDFDITKADKIFDLLLREKQIQLPAGHTIPSAKELGKKRYCKWHNSGSHTTNDCKAAVQAAIEGGKIKFDDSKRPMKVDGNPFPVNMLAGQPMEVVQEGFRKYDKQQEKHYEEGGDGFDPHWGCEFFRFYWNEGIRLPSIEDCPGCSDIAESSSRLYSRGNRLRQTMVPVHQRLGPVNQGRGQEDNENRKTQWCPSGIFTKNQKRRVQILRNRERFQEVEQEINHRLKKTKPRQEWRVKNQVPVADEATDDEARRKLGRNAKDLIKTNMVLMDFGGNPSETKGVLNVELTVSNKTIPTTFFVIDGKGSYSLLLGRDWIHANYCIPSTMHQCLIQWQDDKIEIVPADRSVNVASADLALWEMDGLDCLSGKVWDGDFLKVSDSEIQPIEDGEPKLLF